MNLQGYNVLNVPNEEQLFAHLDRAHIPAIQFLDNPQMAIKTKARYPEMDVTWRQNKPYKSDKVTTRAPHDGALHTVYPDSASFFDERVRVLDSLGWNGDIRIHAHNEPEWSPAVLDWSTKLVMLAGKQKVHVGVGAWSVGNPKIADIPMAKDLLAALNENRKYAVLFLHEYSMAHWTSGFTEDGITQPGERLYFTKFIPRNMWPKDRAGFIFFHCGRFWHWVNYCLSIGIQPPRIIINEASYDDVEEGLKQWANGLPRDPKYHNIRGYKSLELAWRAWYPDWSLEDAYFEQQSALDEFVYRNSPVEARLMFGLGDSGGWDAFNLWNAKRYQQRLEQATQEQAPVSFPLPQDSRWIPGENYSGENYRIRLMAQTDDTPELGWVKAGEKFAYIGIEGNDQWMFGKNLSGTIGYIPRDVLSIAPKPTPVPPPAPPALSRVSIQEQIAAANASISTLTKYRAVVNVRVQELEDELSAERHLSNALQDSIELQKLILEWLNELMTEVKAA
jgi:hypothetical protein